MKICPSCRKEINDNAVMCVNCGAEINRNYEDSTASSKSEKNMKILFIGLILTAAVFVISSVWSFAFSLIAPTMLDVSVIASVNLITSYIFSAARIAGLIMSFIGYFGIKKLSIKK